MEQRRLRLGDILDDYCPRERRVTNHVIIAMIEDDVKQTRCSTCDADHEYKQARVPSTRRKKDAGVLATDVAVEVPRTRRPDVVEPVDVLEEAPSVEVTLEAATEVVIADEPADEPVDEREDDGHVHRRLIRATLPRPEGQVPERKETDFTVRQQSGRGREFEGGRGREIDGNRPSQGQNRHRRPDRPGGERPGGTRFGGPPQGSNRGGGGQGGRGGHSQPGQPGGGSPQGGQRTGGPGGGEGRFRRRRGR